MLSILQVKPGNPETPGVAKQCKTQKDLTGVLGVSKGTVSKYIQRDDWPSKKRGPWSAAEVKKIQAWRKGLQSDRSGKRDDPLPDTSELSSTDWDRLAQIKKRGEAVRVGAQAREAVVKAQLAEQSVVPADTPRRLAVGMAHVFRQGLEDYVRSAPNKQAREERRAWADGFMRKIVAQGSILLAEQDETLESVLLFEGDDS